MFCRCSYPVFLLLSVGNDEVGGALPGERLGLGGHRGRFVVVLGGVGRDGEDGVAAVLEVVVEAADVQPRRRPHVAGLPVAAAAHLVGSALQTVHRGYLLDNRGYAMRLNLCCPTSTIPFG